VREHGLSVLEHSSPSRLPLLLRAPFFRLD